MNKYKEIFNSTQEELESNYPWLKDAKFYGAVIEDKGSDIVWHDGTWECGTWECGIWNGGKVWSNFEQNFYSARQVDGKFEKIIN